ncbi:NAD(P)-binding domain-containing protein [Acidithiobacillus sp. HP-6]|uniref:NAD(P)-binding domain-containing protein n=1 Tax=unclassified Acidithiobacillus TaxID=2614800 RepID=UPI00187B0A79|nr:MULTISPECIES: NAD(P)-binding domain-containing protein [unclassified Acidithiobacillus]MBE7563169.1 NAD(P)-binding domain-containing protein [Acidithiobacillus sp. HP-6]MBE7570225.1 NAD(P)-binding domain-containing protein [Acidithiobacillus sp. HP-2]
MQVGFVGLGQMGSGMAARLLTSGVNLKIFNRSPGKMQALVDQGAAADNLNVPLPLVSLLRDRFIRLAAVGGAIRDWSAIGALAAEDAGLLS